MSLSKKSGGQVDCAASGAGFDFPSAFNALSLMEQVMVLAVPVLVSRIRSLPRADQADLFELLEGISNTNDQDEIESIIRTMKEILSQAPSASRPVEQPTKISIHDGTQKWAEAVGKRIRGARNSAGLSQLQLAEKAGLTQSHVSRLESATHVATHKTLQKVAGALDIPVRDLDPCME